METMQNSAPGLYPTFQCVKPHFDALARVGYFKYVLRNVSPLQARIHYSYRLIMWSLVIIYNFQHVIRVVQVRHSTDQMVDTLFILLTTLNALGKQVAFNARSGRVDNIISIIDGSLFACTKSNHVDRMKREALTMSRLLKLYQSLVLSCGGLWTVFPIINRMLGEPDQFTGYIPFNTSSTMAFALAHAYMSIVINIQGFGNCTMDCTIVGLISQAKIQIQMLRDNLEQFVERTKINTKLIDRNPDGGDNEKYLLHRRFVRCVEHYNLIVSFAKEVESIFAEAMVVQFFVMGWVICMTVYKMVGLSITSAEFVPMVVYLSCMLAQLFIYCYFGTQLKTESEFVNQSIYFSEWLSLTPPFRRQLLIMMQNCSRSITPKVAYVVPMSLETYISVLKSSYTLFTFLDRK